MNWIIGEGKQLTLLVENETRQVERGGKQYEANKAERACLCCLFITLFSVLQVIPPLLHWCISPSPLTSLLLHSASLSHFSLYFKGPLSKAGAVAVKSNTCVHMFKSFTVDFFSPGSFSHLFFFSSRCSFQIRPYYYTDNNSTNQSAGRSFWHWVTAKAAQNFYCSQPLPLGNGASECEQQFIKYAV